MMEHWRWTRDETCAAAAAETAGWQLDHDQYSVLLYMFKNAALTVPGW